MRSRNRCSMIVAVVAVMLTSCVTSRQLSKAQPKQAKSEPVAPHLDAPPDDAEHFQDRYGAFFLKNERRAFNDLGKQLRRVKDTTALVARRQELIVQFWARRDPDPATPENEFKQIVDDRISDIAGEKLFASTRTSGFLFGNNGGWHGDVANVYLLHGTPDAASVLTGNQFHDLMLWMYAGESGTVQMAFLFYQPHGALTFRLFPQDMYLVDTCAALAEVAKWHQGGAYSRCTDELLAVYRDIQNAVSSDGTPGYVFASALTHFSDNGNLRQGKAMEPPEPAALVAQKSGATVVESPNSAPAKAGPEIVRASCSACTSVIPATLHLDQMALTIARMNLDWVVKADYLECRLKIDVVLEPEHGAPIMGHRSVKIKTIPNILKHDPRGVLKVTLWDSVPIPAGTYRISVYLADMRTGRSNAWVVTHVVP